MHKTTLYLPEELRRPLEDAAKRTGRTQADLVREALRSYLDGLERAVPSSIGAGKDEEVTGRSSEGWLRERWSGS